MKCYCVKSTISYYIITVENPPSVPHHGGTASSDMASPLGTSLTYKPSSESRLSKSSSSHQSKSNSSSKVPIKSSSSCQSKSKLLIKSSSSSLSKVSSSSSRQPKVSSKVPIHQSKPSSLPKVPSRSSSSHQSKPKVPIKSSSSIQSKVSPSSPCQSKSSSSSKVSAKSLSSHLSKHSSSTKYSSSNQSEPTLLGHLLDSSMSRETSIKVSGSPCKEDPDEWLKFPRITLYTRDKRILESAVEWLNDNIIHAAQLLLKKQFGSIGGFMVPQLGDRKQLFNPVFPNTPFIQILNVGGSHWITVSNIDVGNQSHSNDTVSVYDSGSPARVTRNVRIAVCSIMKPKCDILHFDLVNIKPQPNGSDCGVFALACATELAHGLDPALCSWECSSMRSHLMACLTNGSLTRFPCCKQQDFPLQVELRSQSKRQFIALAGPLMKRKGQ